MKKNVVITGSTRGIGLAMAKEFFKSGCQVTLSGRNEKLSESTISELSNHYDSYDYCRCDVSKKEDLQRLWDVAADCWGTIDIWINNAGVNSPHDHTYNINKTYTDAVIDTNIRGVIYGSQIAAEKMIRQGHGAIYSMEGLGSNNMIQKNTVLYGTSKHALTYFTKGLAKELANTPIIAGRLSPGMMLTDFITKTPDGKTAAITEDQSFRKIFNILADQPETVAPFLVDRMLRNSKNDVRIEWLSFGKILTRFASSLFKKREIF